MACYVRGCREEPVMGAIHRFFGRIEACPSHNPIPHGYDRPFGGERVVPAPRLDHFAVPATPSPVPTLTLPDLSDPF